MNKKLVGFTWSIAFLLLEWHPEWFYHQTTQMWLSMIAMMIASGYMAG